MASASGSKRRAPPPSRDKGFIQFFRDLPSKDALVRFFERDGGTYYTVHGRSAEMVANEVSQTVGGRANR